jgi:hypothetical protein
MMFIHALEVLLTGTADIWQRILDILLQSVFALILFRYLQHVMSLRAAGIASLLYVSFYLSSGYNVYGEGDVYIAMLLICIASALSLPVRQVSMSSAFFAGLLAGLTITLRPTSLLFVALFGLYLLAEATSFSRRTSNFALYCVGATVPMGVFLLYYSMIANGLEQFYDLAIRFNLETYSTLPSVTQGAREILRSLPLISLAIFGCQAALRGNERRFGRFEVLYGTMIAASFLIVIIQGKFFRYHLFPFFTLLIPIAALAIDRVASYIVNPVRRQYATAVLIGVCSVVVFHPGAVISALVASIQHRDPVYAAYSYQYPDTNYGYRRQVEVTRYIQARTTGVEPVEVLSLDPLLRLRIDRPGTSGYASMHLLGAAPLINGTPRFSQLQKYWQDQFVSNLRRTEPGWLVIATHMRFWAVSDLQENCLRYLPGFDSLLTANYRHDTCIGGYDIYVRD